MGLRFKVERSGGVIGGLRWKTGRESGGKVRSVDRERDKVKIEMDER